MKSFVKPNSKLMRLRGLSYKKQLRTRFPVQIIESESGWGQKVDETLYFDKEQDAKDYVAAYNKEFNSEPTTPSWYMYAKLG